MYEPVELSEPVLVGTRGCPSWCVTRHGVRQGEEDWLHAGEPLAIADGLVAQLCMSLDPDTGAGDGPYVVIGARELTISAAAELGDSLAALARTAGVDAPPHLDHPDC